MWSNLAPPNFKGKSPGNEVNMWERVSRQADLSENKIRKKKFGHILLWFGSRITPQPSCSLNPRLWKPHYWPNSPTVRSVRVVLKRNVVTHQQFFPVQFSPGRSHKTNYWYSSIMDSNHLICCLCLVAGENHITHYWTSCLHGDFTRSFSPSWFSCDMVARKIAD